MIVVYVLLLIVLYTQGVTLQSVTVQLTNNVIQTASIAPGATNYYYFNVPQQNVQTLLLFKRAVPTIFLTAATCNQPTFNNAPVPSLEMYISTSNSNTLPGPGNGAQVADSQFGRIAWNSSDGGETQVWISVKAPTLSGTSSGNWSFEIGASTSQFLHILYDNSLDPTDTLPNLSLDDTDRNNALFLSNIISGTSQPNSTIVMTANIPTELSYSSCAALTYKVPNYSVNTTLTTRGPTSNTRQQFMVGNLTQDTTYKAYMLQSSGSSKGITLPITVYTKTDSNCRLIYDLPFCNQVAYSVPVGPSSYSTSDIWNITHSYDNQAADLFKPFDVALSQFNCETTQYSLVRNCTDCYRDYKTWLCSVTIPRCTDASSSSDLSQGTDNVPAAPAIRDISVNASRNTWIDSTMQPGEWTELLPCIDLCYHVVQSCPPFLQFYCPQGDLATVQYGFWQTGNTTVNGTLYNFGVNNPTCNRLGVNASLLTISASNKLVSSLKFSSISFLLLLYFFFY